MMAKLLRHLVLALAFLLGSEGYTFQVKKLWNNKEELDSKFWSKIEVTRDCSSDNKIIIKAEVPSLLASDDNKIRVIIFFANDVKKILEVEFKENLKGIVYSTPHKKEKELIGSETTVNHSSNYITYYGVFESSWLPENSTRISATIIDGSNNYYNYYGVQNSQVSILDLMVVEEYAKFLCDS